MSKLLTLHDDVVGAVGQTLTHFVPRWYLQHWAGSNERVLRARKTPSGVFFDEQLPNNIGREKDLNMVFGAPGHPGKNFEDQVTRILAVSYTHLTLPTILRV